MRKPALNTLLAMNEKVAFVGTIEGKVHLQEVPTDKSPEEMAEWIHHNFVQPKHTQNTDETIAVRFYGQLKSTDKPHVEFLPITTVQIPFTTYEDLPSGLIVRAAHNPEVPRWTVADL